MSRGARGIGFLLVFLLSAGVTAAGDDEKTGPAFDLAGEYSLRPAASPAGPAVTKIRITAFGERKFVVRGIGQDWVGQGLIINFKGYYDWKFDDGKAGRTELVLKPDGTIEGRVVGAGIDWEYLGSPTKLPPK
ncbi:hypothetical protein [Aquisphaera insulae]|uniref:hypothetical protein n=1 Tax=Aquisphaera insulae TaxID=2712864 RepID=UPI0013ECC2AD|nr:hypothetical protein [Aquisphaera insulae]